MSVRHVTSYCLISTRTFRELEKMLLSLREFGEILLDMTATVPQAQVVIESAEVWETIERLKNEKKNVGLLAIGTYEFEGTTAPVRVEEWIHIADDEYGGMWGQGERKFPTAEICQGYVDKFIGTFQNQDVYKFVVFSPEAWEALVRMNQNNEIVPTKKALDMAQALSWLEDIWVFRQPKLLYGEDVKLANARYWIRYYGLNPDKIVPTAEVKACKKHIAWAQAEIDSAIKRLEEEGADWDEKTMDWWNKMKASGEQRKALYEARLKELEEVM